MQQNLNFYLTLPDVDEEKVRNLEEQVFIKKQDSDLFFVVFCHFYPQSNELTKEEPLNPFSTFVFRGSSHQQKGAA